MYNVTNGLSFIASSQSGTANGPQAFKAWKHLLWLLWKLYWKKYTLKIYWKKIYIENILLFSPGPYCSQKARFTSEFITWHEYFRVHRLLIKHWIQNPPTKIKKTIEANWQQRQNSHFHFNSQLPFFTRLSTNSVWFLTTAPAGRSNCKVIKTKN